MDRTPTALLEPAPATAQRVHALAFDRRLRNPRPVFSLQHDLARLADGRWQAIRTWRAVGPDPVTVERVTWHDGLAAVDGETPSIGEHVQATWDADGCRTVLCSHRTAGTPRERRLSLPHAAVTLASLPLFAARHWHRLCAGGTVDASYLVLKVQRAATVRLAAGPAGGGERTVDATPLNPVLRALFGRTRLVFDADAPRLRRVEGLLDPRDLTPRGRWHEYLGRIAFEAPVDLAGLVAEERA